MVKQQKKQVGQELLAAGLQIVLLIMQQEHQDLTMNLK